MQVVKRDGTVVDWHFHKISSAVEKAMSRSETNYYISPKYIEDLVELFFLRKGDKVVAVDDIHKKVEDTLMQEGLYDVAREYITYRKKHMPDIFRQRTEYRPYEYPQLAEYVQAINHSYWLFTHYNYNSDIQDIKVNMPADKAEMAIRCILAISQIEVSVKKFWANIGNFFPKPEIEEVAATFADSEVRHAQAYSNLLQIMNLNKRFAELKDVPAIQARIKYLQEANTRPIDKEDFFKNVILFSMFIENVSLFSQFYLLLKLNRDDKFLKGTSNAILATSKEEVIHASFGFDLINTIKKERPEWWTKDLVDSVQKEAGKALMAELDVLHWLVNEDKELYNEVTGFVIKRMNESLKAIGIGPIVIEDNLYDYEWFYVLTESRAAIDFFDSKDPSYTKGDKSVTADDLF